MEGTSDKPDPLLAYPTLGWSPQAKRGMAGCCNQCCVPLCMSRICDLAAFNASGTAVRLVEVKKNGEIGTTLAEAPVSSDGLVGLVTRKKLDMSDAGIGTFRWIPQQDITVNTPSGDLVGTVLFGDGAFDLCCWEWPPGKARTVVVATDAKGEDEIYALRKRKNCCQAYSDALLVKSICKGCWSGLLCGLCNVGSENCPGCDACCGSIDVGLEFPCPDIELNVDMKKPEEVQMDRTVREKHRWGVLGRSKKRESLIIWSTQIWCHTLEDSLMQVSFPSEATGQDRRLLLGFALWMYLRKLEGKLPI